MSDSPEQHGLTPDTAIDFRKVNVVNFIRSPSEVINLVTDEGCAGIVTRRGLPSILVVPFGDNVFMQRILDVYPNLLEDATRAPEMELGEPGADSLTHPCFGLNDTTRLEIVTDVE